MNMKKLLNVLTGILGLTIAINPTTSSAHGQNVTTFQITGSPDSYIGPRGQTLTLSPTNGYSFAFNDLFLSSDTPLSNGLFEIDIEKGNSYWSLVLQTPNSSIPQLGLYGNATRWPFPNDGNPKMDLNTDGRGENRLDGWFNIIQLDQNPDGTISALAVDFYEHGSDYGPGRNPWEFGSIRYNSSIPTTTPEPTTIALTSIGVLLLMVRKK